MFFFLNLIVNFVSKRIFLYLLFSLKLEEQFNKKVYQQNFSTANQFVTTSQINEGLFD